jgi:hypothetical protein
LLFLFYPEVLTFPAGASFTIIHGFGFGYGAEKCLPIATGAHLCHQLLDPAGLLHRPGDSLETPALRDDQVPQLSSLGAAIVVVLGEVIII